MLKKHVKYWLITTNISRIQRKNWIPLNESQYGLLFVIIFGLVLDSNKFKVIFKTIVIVSKNLGSCK